MTTTAATPRDLIRNMADAARADYALSLSAQLMSYIISQQRQPYVCRQESRRGAKMFADIPIFLANSIQRVTHIAPPDGDEDRYAFVVQALFTQDAGDAVLSYCHNEYWFAVLLYLLFQRSMLTGLAYGTTCPFPQAAVGAAMRLARQIYAYSISDALWGRLLDQAQSLTEHDILPAWHAGLFYVRFRDDQAAAQADGCLSASLEGSLSWQGFHREGATITFGIGAELAKYVLTPNRILW